MPRVAFSSIGNTGPPWYIYNLIFFLNIKSYIVHFSAQAGLWVGQLSVVLGSFVILGVLND